MFDTLFPISYSRTAYKIHCNIVHTSTPKRGQNKTIVWKEIFYYGIRLGKTGENDIFHAQTVTKKVEENKKATKLEEWHIVPRTA